jgi:DNA modification methylase
MFESTRVADAQGVVPSIEGAKAFPVDTTASLQSLVSQYAAKRKEIQVSFRQLVPWLKVGERATHYLHPYPAKLLPQIAHYFLATEELCPRGGVVLDPFGGTATVALEACLAKRTAYYADANPLARLIAQAKVTPIPPERAMASLCTLRKAYARSRARSAPNVVNIEKWYSQPAIKQLTRLAAAIEAIDNLPIKTLMRVTLSAVARKVSHTDARLSVPVFLKPDATDAAKKNDVWARYEEQFLANVRRLEELSLLSEGEPLNFLSVADDARKLAQGCGGQVPEGTVDLVITSPPYAGAQKYIRASSLSLGWLGLTQHTSLKHLENQSIGREHHLLADVQAFQRTSVPAANRLLKKIWHTNKTRAHICSTYLNEMEVVIQQLELVIKSGGHVVLVIGNNVVCGENFESSRYLTELFERHNFALTLALVDDIKSRGLMTKRNKTANVITCERVLLFKKL